MARICGYVASGDSGLDLSKLLADSCPVKRPSGCTAHAGPGCELGLATAREGHWAQGGNGRYLCAVDGRVFDSPKLKELCADGPLDFERLSPAEIVLDLYRTRGLEAFRLLEGGFVFAILDVLEKVLVLGRDSFGVKTMFYSRTPSGFLFSSSLAGVANAPWFPRRISLAGFLEYLACGYVSAPWTIYQDACAVRPGECVILRDGKVTTRHFHILEPKGWQFHDTAPATEADLVDHLDRLAAEAVNRRLPGTGEVAAYLSGGLDTSLLCALLQESGKKVVAYTLGFNGRPHDEAPHARIVANHLGIEHQSFNLEPDEAFHTLSLLPVIYGQPLADISAVPTCVIAGKVSERFDAVFDGQGPDFLFGNFDLRPLYYCHRAIPRFFRRGLSGLTRFLTRNFFQQRISPNLDVAELLRQPEFSWIFTRMFKSRDLERLVGEPVYAESFWCHRFLKSRTDIPLAERLRLAQFLCYGISDVLFKATAAHNAGLVDILCPYFDHDFFHFAQFLPTRYKFRGFYGKYLQKKLLYRKIPREILQRPKRGFIMDFVEFGVDRTRALTHRYLNRQRLGETGLFDVNFALNCVENYYRGDSNMGPKLWTLLMFEMWREKFPVSGVADLIPPPAARPSFTEAMPG